MVRAAEDKNKIIDTVSVKQLCEMVADEVYTVYARKSIARIDIYGAMVTALYRYVKQCRSYGLSSMEVVDWLNSDLIYHQRFVHQHFFRYLKGVRSTRQIIQYVMTNQLNKLQCEQYLALLNEIYYA